MSSLDNLTPIQKAIAQEYAKCSENAAYFMKRYCYIQHPVRGRIKFDLFEFQERALDDMQRHQFNIVLKSRQTGISTLIAGYSLWLALFQTDKNILVIATKLETAKNLITKVRYMNEHLPSWMKMSVKEDNKLSLRLKNGSNIKASTTASDAGRSEALSLLIFDEAAFIDGVEDVWTASYPTLSTGGAAIALSTPNGVGNWFHQIWQGTEMGNSDWNPIKIHWTAHPERDQEWRDKQTELLGPKLAGQEYDCIGGDSIVSIYDTETDTFFDIKISELYDKL